LLATPAAIQAEKPGDEQPRWSGAEATAVAYLAIVTPTGAKSTPGENSGLLLAYRAAIAEVSLDRVD